MAAEGSVALLAVEDLVRAGGYGEVRNGVNGAGLDDRSVMDVAEDAFVLGQLTGLGVPMRDAEGEKERDGQKRCTDDPVATRHARMSIIPPGPSASSPHHEERGALQL